MADMVAGSAAHDMPEPSAAISPTATNTHRSR